MPRLISDIAALYGPSAPARLVGLYGDAGGPFSYLGKFWATAHFSLVPEDSSPESRLIRLVLGLGMFGQLVYGMLLTYLGVFQSVTGATYLGVAVIISYPLVWSIFLFGLALIWVLLHPKKFGKAILCVILEHQVKRLRNKNEFTLIAVAGSIGKTSTKLAISQTLEATKRVRYQQGNYNDRLTVPLVLFNVTEPSLYNLFAWLRLLLRNQRKLRQPYPFDVAVVELGTDRPGEMRRFAYLKPDIAVLTAIAEEHMSYFKTMQAVADEELKIFDYSRKVLVNTDDTDVGYLEGRKFASYGLNKSDYSARMSGNLTAKGQKLTLNLGGKRQTVTTKFLGKQGGKIVLAAAAVAHIRGVDPKSIGKSLAQLEPFAGRMQQLVGIKDSTLLDDTYNASPVAVQAALDVLYSFDSSQRIAILGSMNELGDTSKSAHKQIGGYCDPKKLKWVVTIGIDAKKYLAPAAKKSGCQVKTFTDPIKAGEFVAGKLKKRAVVLAKGSQNGVFAEEALKPLLADTADESRLVRQTKYWMQIKQSQFDG